MKGWIFSFLGFPITTILGVSVVWFVYEQVDRFERFEPPIVESIRADYADLPAIVTEIDAEFDSNIEYAKKLKAKLLEASDFHSSEVPYKSGENWIGLYKNGDSYSLESTKIIVKNNGEAMYGTTVSTARAGETVFLLRGARHLASGPIATVYDDSDNDFDSYFGENPVKLYVFEGREYRLRLENSDNGYLRKGSQLVLESDGKRQLLRSLNDGCGDCGWSVEWVGDLDRDGKLDFYLDLNNHYNSSEPTLFLSTSAKEGKLLGIFAGFHVVGC